MGRTFNVADGDFAGKGRSAPDTVAASRVGAADHLHRMDSLRDADPALPAVLAGYFAGSPFPGVVSARLFGSRAMGRGHRGSDVDVAVLLNREHHPVRLARSRLGVDLIAVPHRNDVDLVILNDVPPLFGRHILHTGLIVHVTDGSADLEFGDQVRSRAADLEPWLRRMARLKLDALQR